MHSEAENVKQIGIFWGVKKKEQKEKQMTTKKKVVFVSWAHGSDWPQETQPPSPNRYLYFRSAKTTRLHLQL